MGRRHEIVDLESKLSISRMLRAGQAIACNMSQQRRADHCVVEELVRKVIDVNLKK